MIVVAINYRISTLGFLASEQLVQYNRLHNEPLGNYGLHDQRRALDWISNFISGFGGDPSAVTIQGTSAGSLSCHFQTLFPNRKFRRAILASGTFSTIAPDTLEQSQRNFDLLVDAIKKGTSADLALDVLLACDAEEIVKKAPGFFGSPFVDGEYILSTTLRNSLPNKDLPDIMIGAASEEDDLGVAVLQGLATNVPQPDAKILETLPLLFNNSLIPLSENFPFNHQGVIDAYGLRSSLFTPSQDLSKWGTLVAHFLFNVSTLHTCTILQDVARRGGIWLYHLTVTCPYPASHAPKKAHHGINDLILFNNAADQVPQDLRVSWDAAVEKVRSSWIEFVNGGSPWDPLQPKTTLGTVEDMGPVFVFADRRESRVYDRLDDALGKELMGKWGAVLQCCNR
jgi:carboxylesterase type B